MPPPLLRWLWPAGLLLLVLATGALAWTQRHRLPPLWAQQVPLWWLGVSVDRQQWLTTRDGVRLTGSLYLPQRHPKPWPTVLIRLPYGKDAYGEALGGAVYFARHGYAVLVQDVRGKGGSGGEFLPWQHASNDGADTLDWLVRQPWSNGRVGTWGCSALGELQYALARARHPAHAAMVPLGAGGGAGSVGGLYGYFGVYEGGVLQLASAFGWLLNNGHSRPDAVPLREPVDRAAALRTLPVAEMVARLRPDPNAWDHFARVPLADPRWQALDYVAEADRLSTPTLDINTWGDQTLEGTLALAEHARRTSPAKPHHVVIAPGDHCDLGVSGAWGALPVAPPPRDWHGLALRWFNHHLRGQPWDGAAQPRYEYYMLGEDRWLQAGQWPPEQARAVVWHLDSDGGANSVAGNGRLLPAPPTAAAQDLLAHDPANPVPSVGGPLCCTGNPRDRSGPQEQAAVEARQDVLVYTSAPLAQALRLAGPIRLEALVDSSSADADLVARLAMVAPDGRSIGLQEGAQRLSLREGIATPRPLQPGVAVPVGVGMRSLALRVPAGWRLRLHVAASSFPRLERQPLETATLRLHHGPGVVARLTLHALPVP